MYHNTMKMYSPRLLDRANENEYGKHILRGRSGGKQVTDLGT